MNPVVENAIVAALVLCAAAYAFHALAPKFWRARLYARLGIKVTTGGPGCGSCSPPAAKQPDALKRGEEVAISPGSIRKAKRH